MMLVCTAPHNHLFKNNNNNNILFTYFQREGKGGRKKGRETVNVWLPLACPLLGTWPTTQACALTGTRTHNALVCRLVLNPLSHTSQGVVFLFVCLFVF